MNEPNQKTEWSEYQHLVIYRLDQQDAAIVEMRNQLKKLDEIKIEIATFKKTAGVIGAISGFIATIAAFFFEHLRNK
ncbi:MAG: hypothetical protein AB1489_12095 [Acidobacteriota bacterium]